MVIAFQWLLRMGVRIVLSILVWRPWKKLLGGGVTWPIKVHPISEHQAVIHDERIPDNWYSNGWCEICCPRDLLPIEQKLAHSRQEARGERTVTTTDIDGRSMSIVRHSPSRHPDLRTDEEKAEQDKPIKFYGTEKLGAAFISKDLLMGKIDRDVDV